MTGKPDPIVVVRRYLADIPELIEEASHYLIPGSAPLDRTFQGNGKGAVYRIPISSEIFDLINDNDKALDDILLNRRGGERRLGVLPTLGLWVSLVYAELEDQGADVRECCPARQHTVAGECDWLGQYAGAIMDLHNDFYRDIEKLWEELRAACRTRKDYAPTCPACATPTKRNRIEGVYGAEGDAYPAWWRCTGCPKTWVHDAEITRLARTQPRMTLRQIADWLEIPLRTLHNWRSEGRFSTDRRGLVELEHVERAAKKMGRRVA